MSVKESQTRKRKASMWKVVRGLCLKIVERPHSQLSDSQNDSNAGVRKRLRETDPHRLSQRQKAIDKGKNTRSYQLFLQKVPRSARGRPHNTPWPALHCEGRLLAVGETRGCQRRHLRGDPGSQHARTPDKYEVCSAKAWLGKVQAP